MRFEEILVLMTLITGLVTLLGYFYKKLQSNWLVDTCKSFFPVFLLVLCLRSFLFEPFRIPTGSMKPTLVEGDFIIVNKFKYGLRLPILGTTLIPMSKPKVGDIVVFRHPDQDLIKRVVGVPGDHIRYADKRLYINGKLVNIEKLQESSDRGIAAIESKEYLPGLEHNIYVYPHRDNMTYPYQDIVVPANSYFVLGDNRDNSQDGRFWGFVPEKDLLGKAVMTWMSWDNDATDVRWDRIGKSVYAN